MERTWYLLLLSTCFWALSCQPTLKPMKPEPQPRILSGLGDRATFQQDKAFSWFKQNYKAYEVNRELLPRTGTLFDGLTFTIVMGTWCPDSRREVPCFYKILDALGITDDQVTLVNVDRSKQTPEGDEAGLDIQRVPTFIIYRNAREIGRIVESPQTTLEGDLVLILKGQAPIPRYQD